MGLGVAVVVFVPYLARDPCLLPVSFITLPSHPGNRGGEEVGTGRSGAWSLEDSPEFPPGVLSSAKREFFCLPPGLC